MSKKNETGITKGQLLTTVIASVIGTAVVTAFALVRVANSDHFTLVALGSRVDAIEENFVPRGEYEQRIKSVDDSLRDLKDNDREIIRRLDQLLAR